MENKKTLVLGASENLARYSNLAINRLKSHQHPVVAIGKKAGVVAGIPIGTEKIQVDDLNTVTLYLNPALQKEYYDYIIDLHPKRIIFNPGTENDELAELALKNDIQPVEACTLVLLSTGQY
jgi:predicted CoA-binding protein